MCMWRRHSHWLNTTALCSADERAGKMVDGVAGGLVRSKTDQKVLFH